ncbi:MAG: hypothetical protein KDN05_01380 [Verrucomicrobiae bacterium]|nr:hypothetical protein [Verrucomicrobiae bacterium]
MNLRHLTPIVAALALPCLNSCDEFAAIARAAESKAKPELIDHKMNADAWLVNEQLDYGVRLLAHVKNNGQQGDVIIAVTLTSSEGEWTRKQTLNFDADETKELAYVFTEPTVNASNLQYRITTLP